jgi:hypothetical protein
MTSKSVAFSLVIVDHLLSRIEALQKCNKTFKERFEWYEKNRQKLICDCNDLLINGVPYNKPKTTSLHNYGRASNGYYLGYKFVCGVCNTNWFCAESNTESEFLYSWEPADEKVILVKTENKFQPDPSEDFEPF